MDILDHICEEIYKERLHPVACFLDHVASKLGIIAFLVEYIGLEGQASYKMNNFIQFFWVIDHNLSMGQHTRVS